MFLQTLALCVSAFLVKTISGQYVGAPFNPAFGPNLAGAPALAAGPALAAEAALATGVGYGAPFTPGMPGCGPFPAPAMSGGGFQVTSLSPISPNGITVQTDNMAIEGPLAVSGQLPFLGVVGLEGPLPIAGQGVVSYGCGTGNIGIINEVGPGIGGPGYAGPGYPKAFAPEYGPGYGYGFNGYPNTMGPYY